jgi:F0F1-type ATP synthase membrane subunit b/b'
VKLIIAPKALEKRDLAKAQLQEAQKRAKEIKEQGILAAEQEKTLCIKQAEEDANRVIKKTRYNSFTATKAIEQISQQIVSLAMSRFV